MSVFIRACSGLGYSLTALLLLLLTSSLLSRVPSGFPEAMAAPTGRPRTSFRPQIIAANPGSAGPADFDQLLRHTLPHFHIDPDRIPPAVRQKIAQHLHDYTVLHRQQTQAMLRRGAPYLRLIKRILHQHGLPAYFAYIPMAESAFRADVTHPKSGARGLWQLMPNTARAYGLQVSDRIDERLDPYRGTQTAARYLRELQDIFGKRSPLLILAAYNAGETKLSKTIVRIRSRDIWKLYQTRQIPSQTRQYLVKTMTFWLIVANAERYQFTTALKPAGRPTPYTEIMFSRQISFPALAQHLSLTEQHLRTMNPAILGTVIPAHTSIRAPFTNVEKSLHYEVRLTPPLTDRCCARLMVMDSCWHIVKSGETLSAIANRYTMRVAGLKLLNQLEGDNPIIHPGQRLTVCPTSLASAVAEPQVW